MKKIYTALITPFHENNRIDYKSLSHLLDAYLNEVDGFIVCGTTGESSTLSNDEKFALLEYVIKYTKHKKEIYFGCGSNDTFTTLCMAKKAMNYDIDGLLIVTPYYNKPSQNGLYEHYALIASNISLPIILYQVESRCNCVFELDTIKRLYDNFDNIIGLKYASKEVEKLKEIRHQFPKLKIYCGDDALIHEMNSYCDGVISVISHLFYKEIRMYYESDDRYYDFFFKRYAELLFCESNPVALKYVLYLNKYIASDRVRLPLTTLSERNKKYLNCYFDK